MPNNKIPVGSFGHRWPIARSISRSILQRGFVLTHFCSLYARTSGIKETLFSPLRGVSELRDLLSEVRGYVISDCLGDDEYDRSRSCEHSHLCADQTRVISNRQDCLCSAIHTRASALRRCRTFSSAQ